MNQYVKNKFDDIKKIKAQFSSSENKDELEKQIIKITDELKENAIKLFNEPSNIKLFLDNIGKFNNYSYQNKLLIFFQKPDATFVAPFKTYKDLGYSVKSNPDSIRIFIPRFNTIVKDNRDNSLRYYSTLSNDELEIYKDKNNDDIVFYDKKLSYFSIGTIFDISDSTMPYEEIQEKLHPTINIKNAKQYINILENLIKDNNFKIRYTKTCDADGYCDFKNKEIVILDKQTDLMKVKVLLHEFAHSLAHTNLENNYEDYKNDRSKYEVEAESIAYVVSNYLNLKVPEFSEIYLYNWSKNKDFKEIDNSLKTIVDFSSNIIQRIDKKMKEVNFDLENDLVTEK